MDVLQACADISIRRACAFAALGIGTIMLALSFDLALALRSGAVLTSIVLGAVWFLAWRAPIRDIRGTELWSMLTAEREYLTRGPDAARMRGLAGRVLQQRLFWHGDRIALVALVMWGLAGLAVLLRVLAG